MSRTLEIVRERFEKFVETEEGREQMNQVMSLTVHGFMSLLNLAVHDFYFIWQSRLYRQKSGLPMGSRLSPVLANIFMEQLESEVLEKCVIQPKLYTRFVDDIFVVYDPDQLCLQELLNDFNSKYDEINLTCEIEQNQQLSFLDLNIKRTEQTTGH